jgi:hypothetical protein
MAKHCKLGQLAVREEQFQLRAHFPKHAATASLSFGKFRLFWQPKCNRSQLFVTNG